MHSLISVKMNILLLKKISQVHFLCALFKITIRLMRQEKMLTSLLSLSMVVMKDTLCQVQEWLKLTVSLSILVQILLLIIIVIVLAASKHIKTVQYFTVWEISYLTEKMKNIQTGTSDLL